MYRITVVTRGNEVRHTCGPVSANALDLKLRMMGRLSQAGDRVVYTRVS